MIGEYFDKEYMKPLYDYMKNGEKYSSERYYHPSKRMVVPFFRYACEKLDASDFLNLKDALKDCPQLKGKIRLSVDNYGHKIPICYSNTSKGYERVISPYKWIEENSSRLFTILYNSVRIAPFFDKFMEFINGNEGNSFIGRHMQMKADTVFMNQEIKKPQWLIHLANMEKNAISICKNGFTYGLQRNQMDNLGYSGAIGKDSKKGGKYAYAYNAEEIANNFFPASLASNTDRAFNNKFDEKVWEYAVHDAVMFQSSGLEAYHSTDRQQQVIFNADMARNFVRLHFDWDKDVEDDERNTRAYNGRLKGSLMWSVMTVDNRKIYSNSSLTEVVKWVINNFDQYRKQICYKSSIGTNEVTESTRHMKKIHITEKQEQKLIDENIKIHKGEKGKSKSTQGKWADSIECPHCGERAYFTMSISDGSKGRGKIKVTDEFGTEVDTEVQTIALYYCPKCHKFIAQNNMA